MNVKNGFSTLNRLLGKKNKGHHLSKSTTNLSSSSSSSQNHIDTSINSSHHHLEQQNRITPLPIATTNAPFEQTFRITVLLPKGQLFVARLGAKTKLQKLLEIVCENKLLDQEKYEFRHPVDSSQIFNCELTIGAVGLNEIRLCHKSETYNNFNSDDIIKLRHTGRDSLSSSELSSRNSKHTLKTASPYSSTNSLNSIDSTGMNSNSRGHVVSLPSLPNTMRSLISNNKQNGFQAPVAPVRKKRVAPRPPSQNSIPEKEPVTGFNNINIDSSNKNNNNVAQVLKKSLPKKEFHVSSPNLNQSITEINTSSKSIDFHKSSASIDCNRSNCNGQITKNIENLTATTNVNTTNVLNDTNNLSNKVINGHHHSSEKNEKDSSIESYESQQIKTQFSKNRPVSMSAINDETNYIQNLTKKDYSENENNYNKLDGNYMVNGSTETLKVPEITPRKRIFLNKKKAPAPPPRIQSIPVALPIDERTKTSEENVVEFDKCKIKEKVPESVDNTEKITNPVKNENIKQEKLHISDCKETPASISESSSTDFNLQNGSKPIFENSSSDEEEQIKVYNLKLGKTIVKPFAEHKIHDEFNSSSIPNNQSETDNKQSIVNSTEDDSLSCEPSTWAYPIPAPPPNFADETSFSNHKIDLYKKDSSSSSTESSNISDLSDINKDQEFTTLERENTNHSPEMIITSDIEDGYRGGTEKVDFDSNINHGFEINKQNENSKILNTDNLENLKSQKSVIEELNNVINENKLDSVISRTEDNEEIQSPLPSVTLSNFKIQSYSSNSSESNIKTEKTPNDSKIKNTNSVFENQENQCKTNNTQVIEENEILSEKKCFKNSHQKLSEVELFLEKERQENEKNLSLTLKHSEKLKPFNEENKISVVFQKQNENLITSNDIHKENKEIFLSTNKEEKLQNPLNENEKCNQMKMSEEERFYKKRSNIISNNNSSGLTNSQVFKSKVKITRSDSFHSTRYSSSTVETINDGMSLRSSSYISLLNAQNSGRKSSSELIGESPSLQSLIVMKSILNSRKNSLNSESDLQTKISCSSMSYSSISNENSNVIKDSKSKMISSVYNDCDSSKENSPKNKILNEEISKAENKLKHKDERKPEKKWKYQGPPSINLTSWDERPKIQVSIKNDGDYKIGVGGGGIGGTSTSVTTFPRVYRNSAQSQPQQRQQQTETINGVDRKVPYVCSVEYKKPLHTDSSGELNSITYIKPSNSGNIPITNTNISSTTMTLGRMPKINRTASFAPTVKGFRNSAVLSSKPYNENGYHSLNINSETFDLEKRNSSSSQGNLQTWKSTINNLGRSNSIITYSSKPPTLIKHENSFKNQNGYNGISVNESIIKTETEENPFSKVVLRKTGLKEKILSTSENNLIKSTEPSLIKVEDSNCAKLELKLTTTKTVPSKPHNKIQAENLKSSPTPPPPPPIIRSFVAKQNIQNNTKNTGKNNGICALDARCELLSAIRNFNKESLKKF